MDGEIPQKKKTHKGEGKANYSISRVVENVLGNISSKFEVLMGVMEQRPMVVRDIVVTCVVLYNMLRTYQGRADRAPTPANDVAAVQNEQVVYVPDANYWHPLRKNK